MPKHSQQDCFFTQKRMAFAIPFLNTGQNHPFHHRIGFILSRVCFSQCNFLSYLYPAVIWMTALQTGKITSRYIQRLLVQELLASDEA